MKSIIFLFIIILFLFSCNNRNNILSDNMLQVRAAPVTSSVINDEIKGFGSLSFVRKVDVAAPIDGVLDTLLFREGDYVHEGDVIALLSNPQVTMAARRAESSFSQAVAANDMARARLKEGEFNAEARLLDNEKTEAELVLARNALIEQQRKQEQDETLFRAGGVSEEAIRDSRFRIEAQFVQLDLMEKDLEIRRIGLREIDLITANIIPPEDEHELRSALIFIATAGLRAEARAAQANLESARQELESARFLEASMIIRSPMSGTVGARYIEEGEMLTREDKLITIIDTQSLYAIFNIPEAEALKLEKGMTASIVLDGTGGTYNGTVDLVSPQADSQSFTFLVRVIMDADDEGLLKPGMFARITIFPEQSRVINLIPESALLDKKNNQGKVFTIQNNTIRERSVELGQLLGSEREIISGLYIGEAVVLQPDTALKDGAYVSIANQ